MKYQCIGNNNEISINKNQVIVNGKEYIIPKSARFNSISIIDGRVEIKGYVLQGDTFVKVEPLWIKKIKKLFTLFK